MGLKANQSLKWEPGRPGRLRSATVYARVFPLCRTRNYVLVCSEARRHKRTLESDSEIRPSLTNCVIHLGLAEAPL